MRAVLGVGRRVRRGLVVPILAECLAGLAAPSAFAETHRVAAGGNLQAALDAARPGDVVLLAPGATYTGNFVLRSKGGTQFITVQTEVAETGALAQGMRITPAAAAPLARVQSPNSAPAVTTAPGAHHWRLQLLQFGPNHKGYGEIIRLGGDGADQSTLDAVPHSIVIDRAYVYGDPLLGQKRGIAMNARDVTISNCHISDVKAIGQDTQAIAAWNGPGPFVIENNYLEASGENLLLGGAGPDIPNLVPSGLTFRRNHVARPESWRDPIVAPPAGLAVEVLSAGSLAAGHYTYSVAARRPAGQMSFAQSAASAPHTIAVGSGSSVRLTWPGVPNATEYRVYRTGTAGSVYWTVTTTAFTDAGAPGSPGSPEAGTRWLVKNLFELKNARDAVIEHNLFENNWEHGQAGYAIVFTVRNSSGRCHWCTIENVDFRHNVVRHVAGGINILGYDSPEPSRQARDIRIAHNLFYDIDGGRWGGTGNFLLMGDEPRNVTVDHNTIDHAGTTLVLVYGGSSADRREIYGFKFTNNLARHGKYGIFGAGLSSGNPTLSTYLPDALVTHNLIAGGVASRYPAHNHVDPPFETQFADAARGDFRLIASSPFRGAGTDALDLGADLTRLAASPGPQRLPTSSTQAVQPTRPKGLRIVVGGN